MHPGPPGGVGQIHSRTHYAIYERGFSKNKIVPSPRHKYPDRNSELTEIYLQF
jgi:hypothetical protein